MKRTIDLCGEWTLREAAGRGNIPARVPGSVLGALLAAGLMEDPFRRENEYDAAKLLDRDYTFTRVFDVGQAFLACEKKDLVFLGLDTLAEVTLNGHRVLSADNMHRTWRVDVKSLLKPGPNELSVLLRSSANFAARAAAGQKRFHFFEEGFGLACVKQVAQPVM